MLELIDEVRPLRPRTDERHVAFEDVPELRQLVEIEASQHPAERRAPWIVVARPDGAGLAFGVVVHRSKLVDRERLAVEAHALLMKEDGAFRRQSNERGDDERW